MKQVVMVLGLTFFSLKLAAYVGIVGVSYDQEQDNLLVEVQYGGGCREHAFELPLKASSIGEDGAASYSFYLDHTRGADDPCRMLIFDTLSFPMAEVDIRPATIYLSTSPDGSHPFFLEISRFPKTALNFAYFDDRSEELVVGISYSGGCKAHDFNLDIEHCSTSMPPQCSGFIAHTKGQDDRCEMYISETKRFSVEPSLIPSVLNLSDENGQILRVNIGMMPS